MYVFLPSWCRGSPAALDVTVIPPMQQLTLPQSAITQGHALKVASERKTATHGPRCQQVGIQFHSSGSRIFGWLEFCSCFYSERYWSTTSCSSRLPRKCLNSPSFPKVISLSMERKRFNASKQSNVFFSLTNSLWNGVT